MKVWVWSQSSRRSLPGEPHKLSTIKRLELLLSSKSALRLAFSLFPGALVVLFALFCEAARCSGRMQTWKLGLCDLAS